MAAHLGVAANRVSSEQSELVVQVAFMRLHLAVAAVVASLAAAAAAATTAVQVPTVAAAAAAAQASIQQAVPVRKVFKQVMGK
jgi:hypothetical protein